MRIRTIALVCTLCVLSAGTGFGAGWITSWHSATSIDPYRYCFKVYWDNNSTFLGFGKLIPPGLYAICKI